MAKAVGRAPARRSWLWLQGAACGGLAVMAPGTALVLTTLMAAGMAMFVFEQTPGRPLARAMLLMGGASAIMPLRHLWEHGGTLDAAFGILTDPLVPLWSWTASAVAWLAAQLWEMGERLVTKTADDRTEKRLKTERTSLAEEWRGLD